MNNFINMLIQNLKMFRLINKVLLNDNELSKSLNLLLESGFIQSDNCLFLKNLFSQQNHLKIEDFYDKTAYEVFINSFHVEDYIKGSGLVQSIIFFDKLAECLFFFNSDLKYKIYIFETDFGFNIKFHLLRDKEDWYNLNQIEEQQAILIYQKD